MILGEFGDTELGELGDIECPKATQSPNMPKNLCCSLDKLAFMQIIHKADHSKPLDRFRRVL